jgi:2,3-dihydroxy-p-cumate/2,3-dihydroxybenzoate 3,4-dioxygenase
VLYQSGEPGLKRVGWEMENEEELDRLRHALAQAGCTIAEVPAEECAKLHQGRSIRLAEPFTGATFEYYSAMGEFGGTPFVPTVAKIARLGHIVLKTTDLAGATAFATSTLNYRVSDMIRGAVNFLRCHPNPLHHSLALAQSGRRGLHHVNFMVTEIDDIGKAMARFKKHGIDVVYGPGRHPPSGSIFLYYLDPDGLTLEYSFGMEEFGEAGARKHRVLEPVPESIDFWGAPRDPRAAAKGEIEHFAMAAG